VCLKDTPRFVKDTPSIVKAKFVKAKFLCSLQRGISLPEKYSCKLRDMFSGAANRCCGLQGMFSGVSKLSCTPVWVFAGVLQVYLPFAATFPLKIFGILKIITTLLTHFNLFFYHGKLGSTVSRNYFQNIYSRRVVA